MRVYNGTGGEVIWYVTSMSGPNAGQFFEVTIPAGGSVFLNVGDWANGIVIQVLTSAGGSAAFGSTAVLGYCDRLCVVSLLSFSVRFLLSFFFFFLYYFFFLFFTSSFFLLFFF